MKPSTSARPTPRARVVRRFAGLFTLVAALHAVAAEPVRVIAIGDVHGSLDGLVTILTRASLIDANHRWSGGAATLVQTGDYTDRGADVRGVMDLLMSLEPQASKAGGQLIVLLGNHEVMNLVGNTRDVTPEIFATFADEESENRRERAWRDYEQLGRTRRAGRAPAPAVFGLSRDAWMAAHPKGYLEYRAALGPQGVYGRWLRNKFAAARVGGTAFMHAGIDPARGALSLEDMNAKVRAEVARFDAYVGALVERRLALPFFSLQEVVDVTVNELTLAAEKRATDSAGRDASSPSLDTRWLAEAAAVTEIGSWAILAPEGPMWFRGYTTWPETNGPMITTVLERLRADRLVVAHTPRPQGLIASRFNHRLFLIDTGMLASVYKGQPSALEIEGTRIRALYPKDEAVLVDR